MPVVGEEVLDFLQLTFCEFSSGCARNLYQNFHQGKLVQLSREVRLKKKAHILVSLNRICRYVFFLSKILDVIQSGFTLYSKSLHFDDYWLVIEYWHYIVDFDAIKAHAQDRYWLCSTLKLTLLGNKHMCQYSITQYVYSVLFWWAPTFASWWQLTTSGPTRVFIRVELKVHVRGGYIKYLS